MSALIINSLKRSKRQRFHRNGVQSHVTKVYIKIHRLNLDKMQSPLLLTAGRSPSAAVLRHPLQRDLPPNCIAWSAAAERDVAAPKVGGREGEETFLFSGLYGKEKKKKHNWVLFACVLDWSTGLALATCHLYCSRNQGLVSKLWALLNQPHNVSLYVPSAHGQVGWAAPQGCLFPEQVSGKRCYPACQKLVLPQKTKLASSVVGLLGPRRSLPCAARRFSHQ